MFITTEPGNINKQSKPNDTIKFCRLCVQFLSQILPQTWSRSLCFTDIPSRRKDFPWNKNKNTQNEHQNITKKDVFSPEICPPRTFYPHRLCVSRRFFSRRFVPRRTGRFVPGRYVSGRFVWAPVMQMVHNTKHHTNLQMVQLH